jgi:hypothetical protein
MAVLSTLVLIYFSFFYLFKYFSFFLLFQFGENKYKGVLLILDGVTDTIMKGDQAKKVELSQAKEIIRRVLVAMGHLNAVCVDFCFL